MEEKLIELLYQNNIRLVEYIKDQLGDNVTPAQIEQAIIDDQDWGQSYVAVTPDPMEEEEDDI